MKIQFGKVYKRKYPEISFRDFPEFIIPLGTKKVYDRKYYYATPVNAMLESRSYSEDEITDIYELCEGYLE